MIVVVAILWIFDDDEEKGDPCDGERQRRVNVGRWLATAALPFALSTLFLAAIDTLSFAVAIAKDGECLRGVRSLSGGLVFHVPLFLLMWYHRCVPCERACTVPTTLAIVASGIASIALGAVPLWTCGVEVWPY